MAAVMAVTLADVPTRPEPAAAAPGKAKPVCVTEREDAVSALATARLCKAKVEVLSRRTETTQVWALPTGGFSSQVYGGAVRFKHGEVWKPVDLNLRAQPDGSVAPVGHPAGVRFSGKAAAGEHSLASMNLGADTVSMTWTGALPVPELAGPMATYREIRQGVDLVVSATRTGFEQSLVVKDRSAAAELASLTLPLRSKQLRFVSDGPGTYAIKDGAGATVGRVPTPLMWDAQRGPAGEPLREAAIAMSARPRGVPKDRAAKAATAGADAAAGTGSVDLELRADPAWLADPATQYPVTLDPAVDAEVLNSGDTYVRNDQTSTRNPVDHSGSDTMLIGKGTSHVAHSFLRWPTAEFAGAAISSATMRLWNYYSGACGPNGWDAYTVDSYRVPMYWDTQPAFLHRDGESQETLGGDGRTCLPDGFAAMNVKNFVQRAADSRAGEAYMGLRARIEDRDTAGWKQFRSRDWGDNTQVPHIEVSYRPRPDVGTDLRATPGQAGGVTSTTPTLSFLANARSQQPIRGVFRIFEGDTQISELAVENVPTGTRAQVQVPAGLLREGGAYTFKVTSFDGTLWSHDWSAPYAFTVDSVRPAAPFVSCTMYPSTAADNTWGHGGAGQAGEFRFAPAAADTDVAAYVYQLDSDTATTTVDATANPTVVSITPKEDGRTTLTVRAKDRAGNLSDPVTYPFNVGRAGLKLPAAGANVVKRMKLAIDGDATYTKVRFRYRRGPGAAEHDVPLANLHKGNGQRATAYPLPLSELNPYAVWNAMDTLGEVGGVVQVSAKLYTASDPADAPGYQTQWTTVTVDSNGDGAATTEVGPASVNLLTGDATVSSSDVDEFGLSVSRVASSREPANGWVPQGERLIPNQQQVSTDTAGFSGEGTAELARVTTMGQGPSMDALEITPVRENGDTFASVGGDVGGGLRLGMKPGRRYRATGWIYVPGGTGLEGGFSDRALRIVGFHLTPAGWYQTVASAKAGYTDGWQQLSVDLAVPADATEAFFRVYNGMSGSGKKVYWDNLSVRELVAPFGPQWVGGAADGVGGSDYTTLEFPEPDLAKITTTGGGWLTFARNTAGRFFPEPGAEDLTLTKVNDTTYRLADLDGTVTEFTIQGSAFVVTSTWTSSDGSVSRYRYDIADNRTQLKRVINPVEPGVGDCTTPVPARGCQALEYDYATATTATATVRGDVKDQIRSVKIWHWDPAANDGSGAQTAVEVARYAYDDQGGLREVWDPRLTLKTVYEYDAAGRVTKMTAGGQLPWMLDYGSHASDDNPGRLLRVRRNALKAGTRDQVDGDIATNLVYGVPLARAAGGPHDMDHAAVARWGQRDLPTDATAAFGPETNPGTNSATLAKPGISGYAHATVHYLDTSAKPVNAATPGGHIDTTDYDQYGNVVRTLDATNRELALGTLPDAAAKAAELGLPDDPAARVDLLSTVNTYSPDGLDRVETLGPLTSAVLRRQLVDPRGVRPVLPAGSRIALRPHTVIRYDEARPDGTRYHLVTSQRQGAAVVGYPDADVETTITGYAAEKGGASGWALRTPTRSTTNAGTTYTVYDHAGRVVRAWDIGANGADARTTVSVYYTAAGNGADPACGNRPEWAGSLCVTKPAGAITGHDPARMPSTLPTRRVEQYGRWGDGQVVTETVGINVRRTTTTFDIAGRPTSQQVTADNTVAAPTVTTEYDLATGIETVTRAGTVSIVKEHDALGRIVRYTNAEGGVTRTEYDRYGRRSKISDDTGSSTYHYDRAADPRGVLTSVADSVAGTFTAKYSPSGKLIEQRYPGGITRRDTLDASSNPIARTYSRDSDGSVVYAEQVQVDTSGRLIGRTFTGGKQALGYDAAGRLTSAAQVLAGVCTTRTYAYDERTNRTAKQVFEAGVGGACSNEGADSTETHTYDSADRMTDPGYSYSSFGALTAGPGDETLAYYSNDLLASQQVGAERMRWTLDPATRLSRFTKDELVNGGFANAKTKVNHYGDDSDKPRWIIEDAATNVATRMVSGPDSGLAATARGGRVELTLTSFHGDVIATVGTSLTDVEIYSYDEFGASVGGSKPFRYGWLGGNQRSNETLGGSMLMGVRVFRPQLGRFLQVDPIAGGNANAYDYCFGDGVNCSDVSGQYSLWHFSCRESWITPIRTRNLRGYNINVRCRLGHAWFTTGAWVLAVAGAAIGFYFGIWGVIGGAIVGGGLAWWYGTYCTNDNGAVLRGTYFRRWHWIYGRGASWQWFYPLTPRCS